MPAGVSDALLWVIGWHCGLVREGHAQGDDSGERAADLRLHVRRAGLPEQGAYSSLRAGEDYTEEIGHDLNGNVTSVRRWGVLAGGGWGKVTDVSVTRRGDLPQRVVPRLATPNPVEAQAATPVEQTTFSHDANGNMTSDKSRGIVSMAYNVLSLPERAVFSDGSETTWVYTSSGEKLRESHVSADGLSDRVTQYAGGMVFVDGKFDRFEMPWGYVRDGSGGLQAYIRDYQGNVVGVVNTVLATRPLTQFTDYYPYGLPHGDATGGAVSRHKYGGKEYMTESGLNELGYGARHMVPQYGCFTSPDPLAGDNRSVSAWAYCNGDPVNNTDPTGMSTHVVRRSDHTYEVVGGNLNDDDLNIYLCLGVQDMYITTPYSIGVTTSITSFYHSEEKSWAVGSIIDMRDNSGIRFLDEIMNNTPSLEYYALNATTNSFYDFKKTNGTDEVVKGIDSYRGMRVNIGSSAHPTVTSARDIGNIAAGYVAGAHGLSWKVARFGFDGYQSWSSGERTVEGLSTYNAEFFGWQLGRERTSGLDRATNLIGSPLRTDQRFKEDLINYIKSLFK